MIQQLKHVFQQWCKWRKEGQIVSLRQKFYLWFWLEPHWFWKIRWFFFNRHFERRPCYSCKYSSWMPTRESLERDRIDDITICEFSCYHFAIHAGNKGIPFRKCLHFERKLYPKYNSENCFF